MVKGSSAQLPYMFIPIEVLISQVWGRVPPLLVLCTMSASQPLSKEQPLFTVLVGNCRPLIEVIFHAISLSYFSCVLSHFLWYIKKACVCVCATIHVWRPEDDFAVLLCHYSVYSIETGFSLNLKPGSLSASFGSHPVSILHNAEVISAKVRFLLLP